MWYNPSELDPLHCIVILTGNWINGFTQTSSLMSLTEKWYFAVGESLNPCKDDHERNYSSHQTEKKRTLTTSFSFFTKKTTASSSISICKNKSSLLFRKDHLRLIRLIVRRQTMAWIRLLLWVLRESPTQQLAFRIHAATIRLRCRKL